MKNPVELEFIETVRREDLLPARSAVTAAVSGGADSVGLLLLLERFRAYMRWDLCVLHIDHGWRPGSASDAVFVKDLAAGLGIPFVLRELGGACVSGSPEAEFSERRRLLYEECSGDGFVAVGHTATDRAETLLLRLLEGAGLRGLGGMDYVGVGPVRRPLLDLCRARIREYLVSRGQPWREDPTNSDQSMLRNRIRAILLPALEAVRPGSDLQLSRSGAALASWRRVADQAVAGALDFCRSMGEPGSDAVIERSRWQAQERAVRLAMLWFLCGRPRFGADELEKTERWLSGGGEGLRNLPGGMRLVSSGSSLRFGGPDRVPDESC
jgi:tRNA(Ile)-lysidine synthase